MSIAFETPQSAVPSLAVIGGGLAGIAAAEAAVRQGFQVELFEWTRVLGGRAASIREPMSERWIDNGQHLVLGCCTEFLELNTRLGLDRFFSRHQTIPFAQTDGKRWTMSAAACLPNCWQLAPAFLRIPFLSLADRVKTGLSIRKLSRTAFDGQTESKPVDRRFADWLAAERTSSAVVEKFWAPLIFSALSETVDNVSWQAVRKVVRDGFLAGREAMSIYLPTIPLRTIYHDVATEQLRQLGVRLHFLSRIRRLHWKFESDREKPEDRQRAFPKVLSLELSNGSVRRFDYFILAIPVFRNWDILGSSNLDVFADRMGLDRFEPGAITTAHLWLDRPLLPKDKPYSALLGGPGQFLVCHHADSDSPSVRFPSGVYHTVVISASHRLLPDDELTSRGSDSLVARILEQLRQSFPDKTTQPMRLLHRRVTTCFDAVFSPDPVVYSNRPSQQTPFSNLAIAGDWTQTGWPSTLEGAVRSGRQAVAVFCDD